MTMHEKAALSRHRAAPIQDPPVFARVLKCREEGPSKPSIGLLGKNLTLRQVRPTVSAPETVAPYKLPLGG